jgi:hypothetical protein
VIRPNAHSGQVLSKRCIGAIADVHRTSPQPPPSTLSCRSPSVSPCAFGRDERKLPTPAVLRHCLAQGVRKHRVFGIAGLEDASKIRRFSLSQCPYLVWTQETFVSGDKPPIEKRLAALSECAVSPWLLAHNLPSFRCRIRGSR